MHVETVRVTRRELFDLIWSEGIMATAVRYKLTDNGLRKVCIKHRIPLPPRGHLAKLKAGKKVAAVALPPLPDERDITFNVAPRPDDQGAGTAMFQPASDAEAAFSPIMVAARLMRPHPATVALKAALDKTPDRDGIVRSTVADAFFARVHSSSIGRLLRLADAVAKACERRGFELRPGREGVSYGGQLQVVVDGFAIAISFNERARQTAFSLSTAEIARQQRGQYVYTPGHQLMASGELSLKLDPVWGTRLQGIWTDSKKRVVEERLNEVMLGLRRLAIWRRAERVKEEDRQARLDIEQSKRTALRESVEAEQRRVVQLEEDAAAWRRAENIRAYVAARGASGDLAANPALRQWLNWASEQADRIDPLCPNPPSILDTTEADMGPLSLWQYLPAD